MLNKLKKPLINTFCYLHNIKRPHYNKNHILLDLIQKLHRYNFEGYPYMVEEAPIMYHNRMKLYFHFLLVWVNFCIKNI